MFAILLTVVLLAVFAWFIVHAIRSGSASTPDSHVGGAPRSGDTPDVKNK